MSKFRSDLNGRKVVMSRAPMTSASVLTLKVIKDNDPAAALLGEHAIYVSPVGMIRNGGDADGDLVCVTDANETTLQTETLDSLIANVISRTGSDQLEPGAAYWGDHYEIPSAKSVEKKRKISDKNLSLDTGKSLDKPGDRKSLPVMLEGSTLMFQEAVGWVHRVFLTADIYLSAAWTCHDVIKRQFPSWQPKHFTKNTNLVKILAEIYEVPLGGLDWAAYDVFYGTLIKVVKDHDRKFTPEQIAGEFTKAMEKASMNASAAKDVYDAACLVSLCRQSSADKDRYELDPADVEDLLVCVAEMSTLISKAQFQPGASKPGHKALIDHYLWWQENHPEFINALAESSVVFMQLEEYVNVMYCAKIGGVPEIDLDLF